MNFKSMTIACGLIMLMDIMQQLRQETKSAFDIQLSDVQIAAFSTYLDVLLDWNERISLTAIRTPEDIVRKHFLDSFTCTLAFDTPPVSLIDIGSGAGFPGVPLKILYPEMGLTLVDSVGKKTDFLRALVDALGLATVSVLTTRAEDLGQDAAHRERYQWATGRGVALLPVLLEYTLPLVQVGGRVLAQKGDSAEDELAKSSAALAQLGGKLDRLLPIHIAQLQPRSLVSILKVSPTPEKYPRRAGIPAKRPL